MTTVAIQAQLARTSDEPDDDAHDINSSIQELMSAIVDNEIQDVTGIVWRLEFQARSLPHVHLIIIFARPLPHATHSRIMEKPTRGA